MFSWQGEVNNLISRPYLSNRHIEFLQRICDEAGGRLAGTWENEKALSILKEMAKEDGLDVRFEQFQFPGWLRGNDSLFSLKPRFKELRCVGLGYNAPSEPIEAEVVYANFGYTDNYETLDVRNKIVLVNQERPPNREELLRYEAIEIASKKGAKAILFINNKNGGLLLAGVGNFQGTPNPIPAFSITYEDGQYLLRLIRKGIKPIVFVKSNSVCVQSTSHNAIYTIPGKLKQKIVVGAHIDSWDISQGAVDNGVGSAVLYGLALNLSQYKDYKYTIEFVWFNAEELGLWGSKRYVEKHNKDVVLAINLDMPGDPRGINLMGFDYLRPFFDSTLAKIKGFNLENGVQNSPWTNSDHMYFMFEGIPSLTMLGWMEESMYRHYHDFGDYFDKVNKNYITNAIAFLSVVIYSLANDFNDFKRLSREEVKNLLKKHNLESRLRKQKEWIFD
ncbi:MAG: M28 family peptidase [Ignavibacteria bacterium]|nr:M28 family peptidase [Ignavibacteria bacterium]